MTKFSKATEPFDKRDIDTVFPLFNSSVLRSLLYVPDQTHAGAGARGEVVTKVPPNPAKGPVR
jgi:hypothetical protein